MTKQSEFDASRFDNLVCPDCKGQGLTQLEMRNCHRTYDQEGTEKDEFDSEFMAVDFIYCQNCRKFWRWDKKEKKIVEVSIDGRLFNLWRFIYPLLDLNEFSSRYPEVEEEVNKLLKKMLLMEKLKNAN